MKPGLLFAVGALLSAVPAMGFCSVPQPRLVCAEYFASKVVVEATLVNVRTISDNDNPEGISAFVYSLRAGRVFRGGMAGTFQVYESNDSGRATFDWKTGQTYLLFLSYSDPEKAWVLDGCGNSGPLIRAKAALKEIAAIQRRHGRDGHIYGMVSQRALSVPIPQVQVEARGTGGVYRAATNAKGEFEIKVPPGVYSVSATKGEFLFGDVDISYANSLYLHVEPGGCVQLQLAAR